MSETRTTGPNAHDRRRGAPNHVQPWLAPLALAALTPLRRFALPLALGGLATTAVLSAGPGASLEVVAVPVLVAALVTRVSATLGRVVGRRSADRVGDRAADPGGSQQALPEAATAEPVGAAVVEP